MIETLPLQPTPARSSMLGFFFLSHRRPVLNVIMPSRGPHSGLVVCRESLSSDLGDEVALVVTSAMLAAAAAEMHARTTRVQVHNRLTCSHHAAILGRLELLALTACRGIEAALAPRCYHCLIQKSRNASTSKIKR
jgi:hypothetical protein